MRFIVLAEMDTRWVRGTCWGSTHSLCWGM